MKEGRLYRLRCKECGKSWVRWFRGRGEIGEYLRLRDYCPVGLHMVEGTLKGKVRVRRVR
jgi:hypothetical protein